MAQGRLHVEKRVIDVQPRELVVHKPAIAGASSVGNEIAARDRPAVDNALRRISDNEVHVQSARIIVETVLNGVPTRL